MFFENPFWVGVFERIFDGKLSVCKVTFGAEPKDYEIYNFILTRYVDLKFSGTVAADVRKTADNPKRRQREANRQTRASGIGTKSQQALQQQREAYKIERKRNTKEQKETEKRRQYEMKKRKRKEKHSGH